MGPRGILWHGGMFYAVLLILEKLLTGRKRNRRESRTGNPVYNAFGHIYTMVTVMIGWVIFESSTLTGALQFIRRMFDLSYKRGICRCSCIMYVVNMASFWPQDASSAFLFTV